MWFVGLGLSLMQQGKRLVSWIGEGLLFGSYKVVAGKLYPKRKNVGGWIPIMTPLWMSSRGEGEWPKLKLLGQVNFLHLT